MFCHTPTDPLRTLAIAAHVRAHTAAMEVARRAADRDHLRTGGRLRGARGQATTEYALILLAAALVGLMVVAWATAGGGAARISRLFNGIIDAVIEKV